MNRLISVLSFGLLSMMVMLSCSSPASKMKSIAEDAEKNGSEWSASDWASKSAEVLKLSDEVEEKDLDDDSETEFKESLQKFSELAAQYSSDKAKELLNSSDSDEDIDFD